ncbi:hypothetical protein T06_5841 [Trichinella sp. T6]|nr:hypothetical protein T06_12454 [Trichinella sp. T6]KRX85069.1 hypothetical protein T06_5841 [Trichinella sp. T6]
MSSHEARTDANQCSPGVSMAFSTRPSVPLVAVHPSILFLIAMDCLVAADGTQIAFPMVLMFFLVTQVRNCEDEPHLE